MSLFLFALLHISTILMLLILIMTIRNSMRRPNPTVLFFGLVIFSSFLWCMGQLLEVYGRIILGYTVNSFLKLYLVGMIMLPLFLLAFSFYYVNPGKKIKPLNIILLGIPQIVSLFIVSIKLELFFTSYSPINTNYVPGKYFFIHNLLISYPYIIISLIILIRYTIKGQIGKYRTFWIFAGILSPFVINIINTYKLIVMPTYISAVGSGVTGILWFIAIYKNQFIVSPKPAIKHIYNSVADAILVLDKHLNVLDCNQSFENLFDIHCDGNIQDILLRDDFKSIQEFLNSDNISASTCISQDIFSLEKVLYKNYVILILKNISKHHWQLLEVLIKAVDAKNKYTGGHSSRVAEYSVKIAMKINLPKQFIVMLWSAAISHDIGKIGVPDEILNSDKRFEADSPEFDAIKKHVIIGAQILDTIEELKEISRIVRYHHERIDGNGYLGLKGDQIPLLSRIIAVADTYDAMTSGRKYQKKPIRESYEVINILKDTAVGTQLDPDCFNALVQVLLEEGYIEQAQNGDFIRTGKLHSFLKRDEDKRIIINDEQAFNFNDMDFLFALIA